MIGVDAIAVDPHPSLALRAFAAQLPAPLGELAVPDDVARRLGHEGAGDPDLGRGEERRAAVRDLLRHGGYKPTGRGKPSSEYLVRAASEGSLGSINLAVDVGHAVSLASGFPVSVVDLDRLEPPLRVALAAARTSYVFNPSGQTIDVSGLPCLVDAAGPCANAVKDAQRTKTEAATRHTLCLVWGLAAEPAAVDAACARFRGWLERAGAATGEVRLRQADGSGGATMSGPE